MVSFKSCLLAVLSLLSPTAGVVYFVKPTEPCTHSSGCPSNETCHTMDHYASNSSHYFSPDHINVTLFFMPGVHNCTKHLDISGLQTFTMIGRVKEHVEIYMPMPKQAIVIAQGISNQQLYVFTNVCNVTVKNVSVSYISIGFKETNFCAINAIFCGHPSFTSSYVSVINITGSSALFANCTFQENSFIHFQSNAVISIHDSVFHSYNHVAHSPIVGLNSTLNNYIRVSVLHQ